MTLAKFRDARDYPARSAEYLGESGNSPESGARISVNFSRRKRPSVEDDRPSSAGAASDSGQGSKGTYRTPDSCRSWKRARNRGHSRARLSNYRAERRLPERGMKKRDRSGGSRPLSRRRRKNYRHCSRGGAAPPRGNKGTAAEGGRGSGASLILNSALITPTRVSLAPGRLTRRRAAA